MWKVAVAWMTALLLTAQEKAPSRVEKGAPQEPLSLSLRVEKSHGVVGEFFMVYVTVRNNGLENIYLPEISADSVRLGEFVFFDIENQDKRKVELLRFGTGANPTEVVSPLHPGREIAQYYTLADAYRMADIGMYRVRARLAFNPRVPVETVDKRKVDNYWKGEIISNTVTISVLDPKGVDKEVSKIVVNHDEKILRLPDFADLYSKYPKSQYFKYWTFLRAEMLAENFTSHTAGQDKALPWYKKVVDDYEVFELTDDAELAIARIYRLQGKKDDSLQQVRRVLELYPGTNSVSEAEKLLKEIQGK